MNLEIQLEGNQRMAAYKGDVNYDIVDGVENISNRQMNVILNMGDRRMNQ